MHRFKSYEEKECKDFLAEVQPDAWSWSMHMDSNGKTVYCINYEIQNEDKFKVFTPDSVQWARLLKCAKVLSQTDKKNHTYVVTEADIRHCGTFTTIVDVDNDRKNVIPDGTVYYNIISGDLDATTTAMQILKDDYVPLVEDAPQYVAVCFYGKNERRINGSLAQVSNWADNIIRACEDDSITIHVNKKG